MIPELAEALGAAGATIIPSFDQIPLELPYEPFRPHLYTAEELFSGFRPDEPCSYCETPDARIYSHWSRTGRSEPDDILETLARRLHDHSIRDALDEVLDTQDGKRVVGVMGGHSMPRTDPQYETVVRIARSLAERDYLIVTGGGPGAMEAAHLGASLAGRGDELLRQVLSELSGAPTYQDELWLSTAWRARKEHGLDEGVPRSLGIPTWLYGHEPPTPFATDIAKYFANSVREDGLVTIAHDGLIFAPGSAGTIQEIFQDAAQNHYATTGYASPMIFLDEEYWTRTKPVFPILKELADGKPYRELLSIHDTSEDVLERLSSVAPLRIEGASWSFCDAHCQDD